MYQRIRKPIVISTAILFHLLLIFHLFFSPVIIVLASYNSIINASFIVFVLIFLLSLFFGRAYCSWFCPGCGVQEILSLIIKRKSKIRDYFQFNGLRLKSEKTKCNSCKVCTAKCPMNLDVMENIRNGHMQETECILCGNCVDHCKQGAIEFSFKNYSRISGADNKTNGIQPSS